MKNLRIKKIFSYTFCLCVTASFIVSLAAPANAWFFGREKKQQPLEAYNPGTFFEGDGSGKVKLPGGKYTTYSSDGVPTELIAPGIKGDDYIRIPITNTLDPSAEYLAAHEVRLKVREMASQLLETWPASGLENMVAYVTTFTPQHDLTLPTPFGQYMRDAFIYEFNNRGFPVRDYSARDVIINDAGFAYGISNGLYGTPAISKNIAIITGTFYRDENFLFMNVRLVRGSDGLVLRTAQTLFPVTPLVGRMADRDYRSRGELFPPLSTGGLPIVPGQVGVNVK